MRMLRRLSILAAAIVVVGTAAASTALETDMREVERLRGLSFVHGVKERTIDRSQLRPLIREQRQPIAQQAMVLDRWPHRAEWESYGAVEFMRRAIRARA